MDEEQPTTKNDYPNEIGWPLNPTCSLCGERRVDVTGADKDTPIKCCPNCDVHVFEQIAQAS